MTCDIISNCEGGSASAPAAVAGDQNYYNRAEWTLALIPTPAPTPTHSPTLSSKVSARFDTRGELAPVPFGT